MQAAEEYNKKFLQRERTGTFILPKRFIENSCLECRRKTRDLIAKEKRKKTK